MFISQILLQIERHILQELTVSSYVPNDTLLVGGSGPVTNEDHVPKNQDPSMLLLTGPNYSGKSVYMKQARRISVILSVKLTI